MAVWMRNGMIAVGGIVCGAILFGATAGATGGIVISEVAWMGTKTSFANEWIELHNTTATTIDITDWVLITDDETPTVALEGSIPAQSFIVLERTDDTTLPGVAAHQTYAGALTNGGESIELRDSTSTVVDSISATDEWPAGDNDTKQTMEWTGVAWATSLDPGGTPGAINSTVTVNNDNDDNDDSASTESSDEQHNNDENEPDPEPEPQPKNDTDPELEPEQEPSPPPSNEQSDPTPPHDGGEKETIETNTTSYPAGIVVSELMPSPTGPDADNEWVELHNTTDTSVDLSNWQLRDTTGSTHTYTIDEGTALAQQGFLVFSRPTTSITLNNDADGVELLHPDGAITDALSYAGGAEGQSYAIDTKSGVATWTTTPTPGSENIRSEPEAQHPEPKPQNETGTQHNSRAIDDNVTDEPRAVVSETLPTPPSASRSYLPIIAGIVVLAGLAIGGSWWTQRSSTPRDDN